MSRGKWIKRRHEITAEEVADILRRYDAGEGVKAIAEAIGCSAGMVSSIANQSGRRRQKRPEEAMVGAPPPERGDVAFEFNGVAVRRDGDAMCLTQLWRAAGSPGNKRPADWLRYRGRDFMKYMETVVSHHGFDVQAGRGGSTWADKHIALAYATDLEPALRLHVQEVFFAYMDGDVVATTPEVEARLDAGHAAVPAAVLDALMGRFNALEAKLDAQNLLLAQTANLKRAEPSTEVNTRHDYFVWHKLGGKCESCRVSQIMADGKRLPNAELDHWNTRSAADLNCTWLICRDCNRAFSSGKLTRPQMLPFFLGYQARLAACPPQPSLFDADALPIQHNPKRRRGRAMASL